MLKKISFALLIAIIGSFYFLYPKKDNGKSIIAITQLAPHPSLDAIRQGIIDEVSPLGANVEILYENAQGNIALATQIAQKLVSLNPKVIVSITTPSTQAVYNLAHKNNVPVIFSGVSDPVAAKLIDASTRKGQGITGVSDFSPVEQQVALIKALQPHLKKIGVLYNAGEMNSVAVIKRLEEVLKQESIEVVKATVANTQEVSTVAASLIGQVEAIYFPNDNTIASSLESVLNVVDFKMPVYASDPQSVERGCIGAAAYGQYEIGQETGKLLVKYLKGEPLENLPVQTVQKVTITLNQQVADKLGIRFPPSVLSQQPLILMDKVKK